MRDVRAKSIQLSQQFIERLSQSCPMLRLGSPKDPAERGSQVSFHLQDGYAAMQALIDHGVIGDFRAPDMMRFGFTPLFIDEDDVEKACAIIENVMQNELWDRDEYKVKSRVT